jgi:hypothetical protein
VKVGLEFRETMSGSWHPSDAPARERAISFTIRAVAHDLLRFLRDRRAEIVGAVDVEGLASHRPMRGTLLVDPLIGRRIVYDFAFTGDDDRKLRFRGEKSIELLRPLATMTTLPGELLDAEGATIGAARLRFDARSDLGKLLRSVRWA